MASVRVRAIIRFGTYVDEEEVTRPKVVHGTEPAHNTLRDVNYVDARNVVTSHEVAHAHCRHVSIVASTSTTEGDERNTPSFGPIQSVYRVSCVLSVVLRLDCWYAGTYERFENHSR